MNKEFKIPQYTPLQLNSNIAYGLTKENNISKDELDSVQWLCEAYEYQIKQIADLEVKLAEKEKEYKESVEKILSSRDKLVLEYTQDKISFAVEQLRQVQKYIITDEKDMFGMPYLMKSSYIYDYIDNQIKQLKEGE